MLFDVPRIAAGSISFTFFLTITIAAQGADLSPAAVQAWNNYVSTAQASADERQNTGKTFLWIDESPDRAARLKHGEILVSPASPHTPQRVSSGLIHDWIAATFIPDVELDRVIASLREYDSYAQVYRPAVAQSKRLAGNGDEDRFSLVLINKGGVAKIAVDGEFTSSYSRSGSRAWRVAQATHLREIEEYGQSGQHTLPDDQGPGYVWRFYSISRMEERDGGVYLETEVIALSRDIPASVEWLVAPMIKRVAKNALSAMLDDTRNAVVTPMRAAKQKPAVPARQRSSMALEVK